jgi:D-xylose transport system permease protein
MTTGQETDDGEAADPDGPDDAGTTEGIEDAASAEPSDAATDAGGGGTDVPTHAIVAAEPEEALPPAVTNGETPIMSVREYLSRWWGRVRSGDLGSLPIVLGLVVIAIVFGTLDDTFYTERNFTNLLVQMAPFATITIGVVFVLLLGEIDLSVAYVSAVGGVSMTLLLRPDNPGWPWWLAVLVALGVTTLIGLIEGLVITKAGVPSFVVTLAGLLIWNGVVLLLTTRYSTSGTIRIQDTTVKGIANNFLSDSWGWIVAAGAVAGYGLAQVRTAHARRTRGLDSKPALIIGAQVAALAVVTASVVSYANRDRGIPISSLMLLVLLVFWSFVATRMRFGRHVYAVGGNAEAARRAGINVDRIRIMVFMISGFMAGLGGVMLASRLRSVATNTGGGNLLLNVIAAAVIGGTSLFGGTGRVVSALLGTLVIASIANGMGLLNLEQAVQFIITGLVLLAAVLLDAVSKNRRAARGLT